VDHPELPLATRRRERRVHGVGELLRGLRTLLEDSLGRVWVSGETSNLFAARTGHFYFTLKDAEGQIRCALFRNDAKRLPFELENGLEVIMLAEPTVYQARGELQLVVREIEPRGEGALQLAFEQLRRRLEAEGLFDEARKRALPEHPRRVGVVTSPSGAAIRDVIQVSGRRSPGTPLLISPTRVQGDGSELEIAAAIGRIAAEPGIDVVLVVRGGGSLEDLWSFNTEPVVRAIASSPVPIVSGVGHESDFTLADYVADQRAATPSAAAMLALPDRLAWRDQLVASWRRLASGARASVGVRRERLARGRGALRMLAPSARLQAQQQHLHSVGRALLRAAASSQASRRARFARAAERLAAARPDTAASRARLLASGAALARGVERLATERRSRLAMLGAQLDSLSPLAVLGRGYAVARRLDDGRIVREAGDVRVGDRLTVRVASAEIVATTERVSELPASSD